MICFAGPLSSIGLSDSIRKVMTPQKYLSKALDLIETNAWRSAEVDWVTVRGRCLEMAEGALTIAETYPALSYALRMLDDGHSFFLSSSGKLVSSNASSVQSAQSRYRSALLDASGLKVGFVVIPPLATSSKTKRSKSYVDKVWKDIAAFNDAGAQAWIVDLRGNHGGNMWPMLAAVAPLLGTGIVGYFVSRQFRLPWFIDETGPGIELPSARKKVNFRVSNFPVVISAEHRIGILLGPSTASSGEAVVIAFKGRNNTLSFGERTAGLSSCNDMIRLHDGAKLFLTVGVDADRNGNVFESGIEPDVPVRFQKQERIPGVVLEWLRTGNSQNPKAT